MNVLERRLSLAQATAINMIDMVGIFLSVGVFTNRNLQLTFTFIISFPKPK
ncbi:MAG: hypothetical protein ABIR31_03920 [Ginsengibacter sp.]